MWRRLWLGLALAGLLLIQTARAEEGLGLLLLELAEGKRARVLSSGFFEYSLQPGGQAEGTIEVINVGENPTRVSTYPGDCANNSDGNLIGPLLGEANREVGLWMSSPQTQIELGPRERKRIQVKIQVPPSTPAGDYFGYYFLQPDEPEAENPRAGAGELGAAIKVRSRLGVIFVMHVSPSTADQRSFKFGESLRKFKQDGQVYLEVPVSNAGNLFLKPLFSWVLRDAQGQEVARQDAQPIGHLLPGHPLALHIAPAAQRRILARGRYRLEARCSDSRFPEVNAQQAYEVSLP
ncbi:hypothetical protein JST97_07750 [bacterium]|nr:hypothetical protein [bacterium]